MVYGLAQPAPSSAWRLRPARREDAPALLANCMPEHTPDAVACMLAISQRSARNQRGLSLVAALPDGRLVGFGQVTLWPRAAEISNLTVGARWRGQGIGSAVIRQLVSAARTLGAVQVEIGAAQRNTRALRLYQRLGFMPARTVTINLGDGPEPVIYLAILLHAESAATPPRSQAIIGIESPSSVR